MARWPSLSASPTGVAVETQASGVINAALVNNPSIAGAGTSNSNSSLQFRSGVTDPANGTINATVTGNSISNTNAGNTGGRFRAEALSVGAGAGNMCLDELRNNALQNASKEFELQDNSAALGVFNLNQSGNTGTVTNTGARAIGTVAPRPQPGF